MTRDQPHGWLLRVLGFGFGLAVIIGNTIGAGILRILRYDIIDKSDEYTGLSAMMRTTAFPASIIAQMMARGEMKEKGAIPQERCVPPEAFVAALGRAQYSHHGTTH